MQRTTLMVDEQLMRHLKRLAARDERTLTDLVGELLAEGVARREQRVNAPAPKLPTYGMGQPRADLADRTAVEQAMGR